MKRKLNIFMIGSIFLLIFAFVGQEFLVFYSGGKSEMLEAGERINKLCNDNGACPASIEGWQKSYLGAYLTKGNMRYYANLGKETKDGGKGENNQTFKMVYSFFMPDDWFEVQGGVGKQVTSGWSGR